MKEYIPGILLSTGEQPDEADIDTSNPFASAKYNDIIVDEDLLYKYYNKGEYSRAVYGLLRLARNDNPRAAEAIGLMYRYGHGVPQENAQAIKWFSVAGNGHRPLAQHHVGVMHYSGQGVKKNMIQASMWLGLAVMNYEDGPDKERAKEDLRNVSLRLSDIEQVRSKEMIERFLRQHPLSEDKADHPDDDKATTEIKKQAIPPHKSGAENTPAIQP
jgi:TPR repeat protein